MEDKVKLKKLNNEQFCFLNYINFQKYKNYGKKNKNLVIKDHVVFKKPNALLAERSMRMVQVHITVRWRRFERGKAQVLNLSI